MMGRLDRFVKAGPDNTERIPLSDGDWIEVRKKLNTGEQKRLDEVGKVAPVMVGGKIIFPIDWAVYEVDRAAIWLLDWSIKDAADKPVALSVDAIRALDPDDFEEINTAIVNHMAKVKTESDAKKASRAILIPTLTPGT